VFQGGMDALAHHQPALWFELNPSAIRKSGHRQEEIFATLRKLGYRQFFELEAFVNGRNVPVELVSQLTDIVALV